MAIEFSCNTCGKVLRTSDDRAGARAMCPECGEPITVPAGQVEDDAYDLAPSPYDAPPDDAPPAGDAFGRSFGSSPQSSASASPPAAPADGADRRPCPMCGESIRATAVKCRFCGDFVDPTDVRRRSAATGQPQFEYAGFWMRFAAALIDGIVMIPVAMVIVAIMVVPNMNNNNFNNPNNVNGPPGFDFQVSILMHCIAWIYFATMESTKGATLGKMALGLIVVDERGEPIGFGRATGRHFGKLLSQLIIYIGYIMAGFTEKKQALHDMMAGCLVIKKPRGY